ncbi:hypothetical protein B0H65DRAFT_13412 [Neurospora tetraspora]|uniref:5'-3' DNA helicase ZGRF1-like N-terminal domain-containing protein n=1 Tax=Neurospora tetraspora TaxID=94610 RepID=A0AAE0JP19_9PEZI|nr:hypothetical protein B0H65DRAFT_13412 [Neurospora tetraspora]
MASVVSSGRSAAGANETGSTAPVLEFLCLFTHDLKRKQKRWQDGRLKYHTFNRRVMVHDDRGNYVGDMHWRRDWDFDEGEEIELERGGVIVQVAECVARQQQDLSELIDKRAKEKEQRQAIIASRPARPTPAHTPLRVTPRNNAQQDYFQTRHRPLNQLLGTPTGHHGRALVSNESPFEQRHSVDEPNDGADSSRPSKRRRYEDTPPSKMGYAQSLFGAPLTLSGAPASSAPLRRPAVAKVQTRREPSPPQELDSRQQEESIAPTRTAHTMRPNRMTTQRVANVLRPTPAAKKSISPPEESLFVSQEDHSDPVQETSNHDDQRHHAEDSNTRPYGRSSFFTGSTTSEAAYSSKPPQVAKGKGTLLSSIGKSSALLNNNKSSNSTRSRLTSSNKNKQTIILDDDDDDENEDGREQRRDASPPPRPVIGARSKRAAPVAEKTQGNKRKKTTSVKKPVTDKGARQKPQNESDPVTLQDEPMVELKIKSRQKRGLLVLSEKPKRAKRPAKSPSNEVATEPMEERTSVRTVGKNENFAVNQQETCPSVPDDSDDDPFASPMPVIDTNSPRKDKSRDSGRPEILSKSHRDRPVANQDRGESAAAAATDSRTSPAKNKNQQKGQTLVSDSDSSSISHHSHVAQRKGNAQPKEVNAKESFEPPEPKTKVHIEVESEKEDEEISRYPRRRRTTRRPASPESNDGSKTDEPESAAESADEELPQVPVGPRLAKLARKSIKSREVIGFVPSSSPVINIHKQAEPVPGHPAAESRLLAEESSTSHSNTKNHVTPKSPKVTMAENNTERTEKPKSTLPLSVLRDEVDTASLQQPEVVSEQTSHVATSPDSNNVTPEDDPTAPFTDKQAPGNELTDRSSNVVTNRSGNVSADIAASATVRNHKPQPAQEIKEPPLPVPDQAGRSDGSGTKEPQAKGDTAMSPFHNSRVKDKRQTDIAVSVPVPLDGPAKTMPPVDNSSNHVAPVRIVNPATRGRKAALKSHAAGQVPQSILPAEPPPERIVPRTRELSRREATGSGPEERPKRKMTFPGFTSARAGGPWSREAYDLLETGRPA